LADRHGRAVRVVFSREDVVRFGPKRPPIAAGIHTDGTGVIRVASAPQIAAAIRSAAPGLNIEEVGVAGPPVSAAMRGAGWAEAAILVAAATSIAVTGGETAHRTGRAGAAAITAPGGGRAAARVEVDADGRPVGVDVTVSCGDPLDEVVVRSYATGAAHMGLGWVCSEAIAVDEEGVPEDLTIRSFGILRAKDTPMIRVTIDPAGRSRPPTNCSDAVMAAVAAATWIAQGLPPRWPTLRGRMR
jgi:CO/xanthine dehydrogenase Mo-binding subunit